MFRFDFPPGFPTFQMTFLRSAFTAYVGTHLVRQATRLSLHSRESAARSFPRRRHLARGFRPRAGLEKGLSKRAVDCFSTETIFVYSEPRSSQPNPLTTLLKNEFATSKSELLEEVTRALTDLPPDQREAIHLILGPRPRKLKEMCRDIGVPYSTLRSRMIAGLERIRRKLKVKGLYRPYLELKQIGSHRHGS